jgi:putative colanic acid biosysnthesis UDP-glucose lipid carrier transferase
MLQTLSGLRSFANCFNGNKNTSPNYKQYDTAMTNIAHYRSLYILVKRLFDILLPYGALYISSVTYGVSWNEHYALLGILGGFVFTAANQFYGSYDNWRGRSMFDTVKMLCKAWGATLSMLIIFVFLLKYSYDFSRVIFVLWALLTLLTMLFFRYMSRQTLRFLFKRGFAVKKIAIAGGGNVGRYLIKLFRNSPCFGYIITGLYDNDPALLSKSVDGVTVCGNLEQASADAQRGIFEELYLCMPLGEEKNIVAILNQLSQTTVIVKYVPDLFAFDLLYAKLIEMNGLPVISLYDSPMSSPLLRVLKRVEDLVITSFIMLVIWPVMLMIAIGVKLSSPGPVFYRQTRIGWNGKPFSILKFRSMPLDLEKNSVVWGNASQKTVTKFGQFIRSTSLDELPQLLNVLAGDMSIVGPRPERDIFIANISAEVPHYMQRHMVKAGITGWAQINGFRGDTSLKKRVECDLFYITHWSLLFDIKIIFRTAFSGWKVDTPVPSVE